MKERVIFFYIFFLFSLSLFSCGGAVEEGDRALVEGLEKSIEGYKDWEKFPGLAEDSDGYVKGGPTHGKFIRVFVNKKDSLTSHGSIIVKEVYQKKGELYRLAVMEKKRGYNPDGGDWFWLYIQVAGGRKVLASGRASLCSDCHSSAGGGDYIYLND